jgi:hypothetical protein
MLVGFSSFEQKNLIRSSLSTFNEEGYTVSTIEQKKIMLGEMSFSINEGNYDFGIYVDTNASRTKIRLLGDKGRNISLIELEQLNKILKDIDYNFDFTFNKIKNINNFNFKILDEYFLVMKKYLDKFLNGELKGKNKIVINTFSDVIYEDFKKRFGHKVGLILHLSQKRNEQEYYDVSSPSSFRESYFIAKKEKAQTIINIDGSGTRISLAIRHNKT